MKHIKIKILGLGLATLASLGLATPTFAWGPERPTYTNEHPAERAVFNSITNNAAVGDERDFVRIVEKDTGNEYVSELEIEAGKQYEVYIYYHNDASETFDDAAHGYVGVARDVRLASVFPHELKAGERQAVTGKITASNTDPLAVWDEAYITAKEAMTLHYVTGSAKIYNGWGVNGSVLPTTLFSTEGTFLGLNELNGVILGCAQYSGQVVYTIETKAVTGEVPTPENPDVPSELPETGPAEIVLAVVVVLAVAAGIVYYIRSKKAVKKTTKSAKSKKNKSRK